MEKSPKSLIPFRLGVIKGIVYREKKRLISGGGQLPPFYKATLYFDIGVYMISYRLSFTYIHDLKMTQT